VILVIAGGDGSQITTLMNAKEAGVDISKMSTVCLPYGTGNDYAKVTGWGSKPEAKYYKTMKSLVRELCLNTEVKYINVWHVDITFQKDGEFYEVDSRTRAEVPREITKYSRDMVNYFGLGEDGRVGYNFE
jgi:hypothetical protein